MSMSKWIGDRLWFSLYEVGDEITKIVQKKDDALHQALLAIDAVLSGADYDDPYGPIKEARKVIQEALK